MKKNEIISLVLSILIILLVIIIVIIYFTNKNKTKEKLVLNKVKLIQFKNFWSGFESKNNFFTKLLSKYDYKFKIFNKKKPDIISKYDYKFKIVDKKPDIIIFSCFGDHIINKNIKNIFYTGENKEPIKDADLNLTFQNSSDYNNIRLPLWILYGDTDYPPKGLDYFEKFDDREHIIFSDYNKNMTLTKKNTTKFCCFVASNNVEYRNNFCKKLSLYKKVDCGGTCLNNVGGKVGNKIEFQQKYKFCIAYENTIQPGYTTEKILEAYKSNCIPIYCGSKTITDDFNSETFINAHDFDNEDDLINYIKKVDTNKKLYNSFHNKPIFSKKWLDIFNDKNETYFRNIAKKIFE